MEKLVQQWIRPDIQALSAYHVPDASGYIKLDAMENPYRWDEALTTVWLESLRDAPLNLYPDPSAKALKADLRKAMQVPEGYDILLGNGSDELIQMLAMALVAPGRCIIAPEPSFVMYKMIALFCGMEYHGVPLCEGDFSLDKEAMLSAIAEHQPALVFLSYPNNPTGNLFERADVEAILEAAPGLVVVDEAYCAFAADSFMNDLSKYPNLLVMRTLSKVGLAGLRLGLMAGAPAWIEQFDKVRLPYNINVLTQQSAAFALQHYDVLIGQTELIKAERGEVFSALQNMRGVEAVWPSEANFLLFRVADALNVFEQLKQHNILIKKLHGAHPMLEQCLRVTVGKPEENQAFLSALASILSA